MRPLLPHEGDAKDIITIIPPARVELPRKAKGSGVEEKYPFDFDKVVRADTAQASKEMYAALVLPVVERFCQGFNATVLAYGQTGSGKTYTMGTSITAKEFLTAEPIGVVPRTIKVLFAYIQVIKLRIHICVFEWQEGMKTCWLSICVLFDSSPRQHLRCTTSL